MRSAAEMYPDKAGESYFYGPCDYAPIIAALGVVIASVSDDDYQGDTFAVVAEPLGRVGFVCIGWGSCSGCDSLQACESLAEIDVLAASIADSVRWFETGAELIAYLDRAEERNDYHAEKASFVELRAKAREALS